MSNQFGISEFLLDSLSVISQNKYINEWMKKEIQFQNCNINLFLKSTLYEREIINKSRLSFFPGLTQALKKSWFLSMHPIMSPNFQVTVILVL